MNKHNFITLFLACIVLLSCKDDDFTTGVSSANDDTVSANRSIDPAFLPFVEDFFDEMEPRGLNFQNRDLTMVFVNELSAPNSSQFCAYGYVNFNGTEGPRVEVKNTPSCWNTRNYTEKENLIFHELGHALLARGHFSTELPNGMPRSIMCTQTCSNYRVYNKYQTDQRAYYLDELATQGSPAPGWSGAKNFTETLFTDNFNEGSNSWEMMIENDNSGESPFTFFVEEDNPISPPFSLGIQSNSNAISSQRAYWFKYFDVSGFEACSNVVIKADMKISQLTDGYVALVVEQVNDNNGTPEHFGRSVAFIDGTGNVNQDYEDFTSRSFCLPETTDAIRVLFYLQNTSNAKILFDNLEVELYE